MLYFSPPPIIKISASSSEHISVLSYFQQFIYTSLISQTHSAVKKKASGSKLTSPDRSWIPAECNTTTGLKPVLLNPIKRSVQRSKQGSRKDKQLTN